MSEPNEPQAAPERDDLRSSEPYSVLAAGYDVVMEHVEYEAWAEFVHHLLGTHGREVRRVLELGCGTGSFAFELQELGGYEYIGTDGSSSMIRVARAKAELYGVPIQFEVADFTNYRVDEPVDAVVLLYDGLNYVLEEEGIEALFRCTHAALRPGGLFIFDQSTPSNSLNNEPYFEDEGETDEFSYVRHSRYDPTTRLHTTTLDLTIGTRRFREKHVQRAYDLEEVRAIIDRSPFEVVESLDSFSTEPASADSERIHWVLRK